MIGRELRRGKQMSAELSRAVFATGKVRRGSTSLNYDIQQEIWPHIPRLPHILCNTLWILRQTKLFSFPNKQKYLNTALFHPCSGSYSNFTVGFPSLPWTQPASLFHSALPSHCMYHVTDGFFIPALLITPAIISTNMLLIICIYGTSASPRVQSCLQTSSHSSWEQFLSL